MTKMPKIKTTLEVRISINADGEVFDFVFDSYQGAIDCLAFCEEFTPSKSSIAAYMGHKGGIKGGVTRAKILSPERRSEIARKAANARWAKLGEI